MCIIDTYLKSQIIEFIKSILEKRLPYLLKPFLEVVTVSVVCDCRFRGGGGRELRMFSIVNIHFK